MFAIASPLEDWSGLGVGVGIVFPPPLFDEPLLFDDPPLLEEPLLLEELLLFLFGVACVTPLTLDSSEALLSSTKF